MHNSGSTRLSCAKQILLGRAMTGLSPAQPEFLHSIIEVGDRYTSGWALIRITFDPVQEVDPKVG